MSRGYPGSVFDSIGWGEIVVVALAALFIFGPERLPDLAKDAAQGLKKVREAITGIREQYKGQMITSWLGPNADQTVNGGYGTVPGEQWIPYQAPNVVTPVLLRYPSNGPPAWKLLGATTTWYVPAGMLSKR